MDHSPLPARRKKFTLSSLLRSFEAAVKTFPFSSMIFCLTTLWLIILVLVPANAIPENISMAFSYVLPLGCLLSTAISIWSRYIGLKSRNEIILQLIAIAILIADWIFFASIKSHIPVWMWCGQGAAMTAAGIACIFVPRSKTMTYGQALNFTNSQTSSFLISAALSLALGIGILVFFETIEQLFGLSLEKLQEIIIILFSWSVCSFIFLSRIPTPEQNREKSARFIASRFRRGLTKFILIPASVVYMAVLYLYGLKVVLSWNLPNGFISTSVTILSALVFVTLFEIRISDPFSNRKTSRTISRWLSILMIPLLAMLTVAIWYRLSQYGPTPRRFYLASFNIWAYIVFCYLSFPRNFGKLNNVALFFAASFLLVSVIPYLNLTGISYRIQRNSVKEAFASVGVTSLPLDENEFNEAVVKMSPQMRQYVYDQLYFLDDYHEHYLVSDIISFQAPFPSKIRSTEVVRNLKFRSSDDFVKLPEGYSSWRYFYDSGYRLDYDPEDPVVKFTTADSIRIPLDINRLKRLPNVSTHPDTLIQTSEKNVVFMPMDIDFTIDISEEGTYVSIRTCRGFLIKK